MGGGRRGRGLLLRREVCRVRALWRCWGARVDALEEALALAPVLLRRRRGSGLRLADDLEELGVARGRGLADADLVVPRGQVHAMRGRTWGRRDLRLHALGARAVSAPPRPLAQLCFVAAVVAAPHAHAHEEHHGADGDEGVERALGVAAGRRVQVPVVALGVAQAGELRVRVGVPGVRGVGQGDLGLLIEDEGQPGAREAGVQRRPPELHRVGPHPFYHQPKGLPLRAEVEQVPLEPQDVHEVPLDAHLRLQVHSEVSAESAFQGGHFEPHLVRDGMYVHTIPFLESDVLPDGLEHPRGQLGRVRTAGVVHQQHPDHQQE